MTDEHHESIDPLESLLADPALRIWADGALGPSGAAFVAAGAAALGGDDLGPFVDLERERALRALLILQIVAPYWSGPGDSWVELLGRLPHYELGRVEEVLGDDTLLELLAPWGRDERGDGTSR